MMRPYEQRFPWDLDWNLLRTYMVLVEQGGITKAANYLGLTQPTLSSALKRLEDTIGLQLIQRSPGGFAVTNAGKVLYAECSTLFGTVSQIPELMTEVQESIGGHISIAMTSHVVSAHFDDVLKDFARSYPDVTLSFTVMDSSQVLENVRENRVSFGICLMSTYETELEIDILYQQYFGLYCGPNHEIFGREHIDRADMLGQPSVSFQTEAESGPLADVRILRERAGLDPRVTAVTANLPELRRLIVAGFGIGALPTHIAKKDVAAGLLWPVSNSSDLPLIDMFLVKNPKRTLSPGETIMVEKLDRLIKEIPLSERTYK